jgi:hypothetical protein
VPFIVCLSTVVLAVPFSTPFGRHARVIGWAMLVDGMIGSSL